MFVRKHVRFVHYAVHQLARLKSLLLSSGLWVVTSAQDSNQNEVVKQDANEVVAELVPVRHTPDGVWS